jgi:Common central domain of tyrosinase
VNTGGCMNRDSSPNDPLFWLHHAEVDRLWAIWQQRHPDQTYLPVSGPAPPGTLRGDLMAPWDGKFNSPNFHYWFRFQDAAPESTRARIIDMDVDVTTLGYRYESLVP